MKVQKKHRKATLMKWTKEELVDYLETTKKGFVKARLQSDPVYFSTNPMENLIQLWEFEFYGEMIKEIDILLTKC